MSKKTQDQRLIKINPNCVPFQLQVGEACRLCGLLSEKKPGNASRKKDFRFPTKEQTGFQIEKAEGRCAMNAAPPRSLSFTQSRI